jgi:hypothetical protein
MKGSALDVSWRGEREQELRASFVISGGQPMVHELAVRKALGNWIVGFGGQRRLHAADPPEKELTSSPVGLKGSDSDVSRFNLHGGFRDMQLDADLAVHLPVGLVVINHDAHDASVD